MLYCFLSEESILKRFVLWLVIMWCFLVEDIKFVVICVLVRLCMFMIFVFRCGVLCLKVLLLICFMMLKFLEVGMLLIVGFIIK